MAFDSVISLPEPSSVPYKSARPFPFAKLDGLWDEEFLKDVAREVDAFSEWDGEKAFFGSQSKRWCRTWDKLPASVVELINYASRPAFLRWLEAVTGEEKLMPDPYLDGGGIHSIDTGGFLKMHADFNWHEKLGLYRRINVLIYLNRDWDENWGGDLRLAANEGDGLDVSQVIFPHFNTMVIFTTDDRSFHGHPDPITAPEGRARNSIALYYYSPLTPAGSAAIKRTNTDYRQMDGNRIYSADLRSKLKHKVSRILGRVD